MPVKDIVDRYARIMEMMEEQQVDFERQQRNRERADAENSNTLRVEPAQIHVTRPNMDIHAYPPPAYRSDLVNIMQHQKAVIDSIFGVGTPGDQSGRKGGGDQRSVGDMAFRQDEHRRLLNAVLHVASELVFEAYTVVYNSMIEDPEKRIRPVPAWYAVNMADPEDDSFLDPKDKAMLEIEKEKLGLQERQVDVTEKMGMGKLDIDRKALAITAKQKAAAK